MRKSLIVSNLEKVFPVVGKIFYAVAILLTFAFLLFDATQKNNKGIVGLSHSMEFGNFVLNINEERGLTGGDHLARMLSLRSALQAVDNKALVNDGIILSRDIFLISESPGNYRIKILLNDFSNEVTTTAKEKYLDALKKFYNAYDLKISWVAGIAG